MTSLHGFVSDHCIHFPCFSLFPSTQESATASFLYRPFCTELLDQTCAFLQNVEVPGLPGTALQGDTALLCPSPANTKGLPTSSKHSSWKRGCRYECYSINTTQLGVSTHVGVPNASDNVFSSSGMSTNTLVFSACLWGWSGREKGFASFSAHISRAWQYVVFIFSTAVGTPVSLPVLIADFFSKN